MIPALTVALMALIAAGLVLWPLRHAPCRRCLAMTAAIIVAASVLAYRQLGSAPLLGRIAQEEAMNDALRTTLQAHMQAIAARPDDAGEWRAFGRDLMIGGRYAEAGAAFEQAYAHGGDRHLVYDVLTARFLAAGGHLDEAAEPWLALAKAQFPGETRTHYYAALRLITLGREEEARKALRAVRAGIAAGDPLSTLIDGQIARLGNASVKTIEP